ncbi:hypothetical protein A1A1_09726 [Planococcus antarcticus DSM 14505]|uniref:Uncharacterized protein n=1 Tax=Planococcus antarcticus DSM 14505 TaxID=1185653 RepID=A0A1C7DGT7_9BACL|nr:hypothetical protein [Planococcus antarcticus]ANU10726.1 hypothetical protein BBH88_10605 [Planococcus antarcticus DSM 14505]EIM06817.1 hypothetical protein A1A1_09726 [Planococcus antarcticus DSM 14505]
MKELSVWSIICFIFATIICVFGQEIAYFLNDYVWSIAPIYYLTGLTVLGIALYLVTGVLVFLLFRKKEFVSENREIYLMLLCITAPSASVWAFFVTVMWWG